MKELDRFTCEEAFRRLADFLDGELSPADMAHVQEHLDICDRCTREFSFERSMLAGVREGLRRKDVPADLQAKIVALLGGESN